MANSWFKSELIRLEQLAADAEEEKIPYHEVAEEFSKLNSRLNTVDPTIGPNCSVIWRYCDGGGSHAYFGDPQMMPSSGKKIEQITNGLNMGEIAEILMQHMAPSTEAMTKNEEDISMSAVNINREIAKLPRKPDEELQ